MIQTFEIPRFDAMLRKEIQRHMYIPILGLQNPPVVQTRVARIAHFGEATAPIHLPDAQKCPARLLLRPPTDSSHRDQPLGSALWQRASVKEY